MLFQRVLNQWHICVDTGGTFTDCIGRDPHGNLHRAKVLSSSRLRGRIVEQIDHRRLRIDTSFAGMDHLLRGFSLRLMHSESGGGAAAWMRIAKHDGQVVELAEPPPQGRVSGMFEVTTHEPAPILAARVVTATAGADSLPPMHLRLATTRGTNALLERAGANVAFFVTRGFGDLLRIGDQQRPDLFALNVRKREPLHYSVVEVYERLAADGSVLQELDENALRKGAQQLVEQGVTVAAVALLHSYRNSEHEQRIESILREAGFTHVSCSSELAPLIEILPRAETAVVDAYLSPVIEAYMSEVVAAMTGDAARVHVMTSAGGLVSAGSFHAKDSLLSGPAGGVAGAAAAGRASGCERIIGFDMGGTSTDVARVDGDFEYRFEHTVGGARLVAPALAIETVAAGGGSMCEFLDDRLRVGPRSAGADPGPACYGAGGPLTITDINLLSGRLAADQFEIPIDAKAAKAALQNVAQAVQAATGHMPDVDELLDGFLAIANERMADAIAHISLRRGYDAAEYALVSFGGAGGQHACALAAKLGMRTIIMPRDASLLSAVGLDEAVIERFSQRQVLGLLDNVREEIEHGFRSCASDAAAQVKREGVADHDVMIRRRIAHVRLAGQDATLAIDVDSLDELPAAFAQRYQQMYGHAPEGKPIEIESIRVVASSKRQLKHEQPEASQQQSATPSGSTKARFDGQWKDVPTFTRELMQAGDTFDGPAIVFDRRSSFVIESGWSATLDAAGAIVATASRTAQPAVEAEQPEVARLELFTSRLESIAEEMGQILERTALSTNVKRRLDFSCGVLDANGRLVVNAPHIPVHLGALGLCVRSVCQRIDMQPGDCVVTNHPAYGGSHLPDVTVITPVFDEAEQLLGYVASRAHHAEIGGARPGSMPPMATTLAQEGVVIEPMHILRQGASKFDSLEQLLRTAAFPSRAVEDNLADVRAAVAANHRGAQSLQALARQHGREELVQRMDQLRKRAARLAHASLRQLGDGEYVATERLDDGSPIAVRIRIAGDRAEVDFTGTANQHPGNLNATPAIVQSALLYVFRLMIGERLPLNEGILDVVDIVLPPGLLNPAFHENPGESPAVVGGNTETSQRLVDTLMKALKLSACSQGTMNNTLFGNESFGYYETVCGGCGAGRDFDGADAVHSHMTNTRITDVEIIEHRYPVRVERFEIRRGSGGDGAHRGGDGVTREIRFLQPVALSVLTQHRSVAPFGMDNGRPGATGRQHVVRADGEIVQLQAVDQCDVREGDRLILDTPGGGGYGRPSESCSR